MARSLSYRLVFALTAPLLVALPLLSQTPAPPAAPAAAQQGAPASSKQPITTLHTRTDLVVIDVVVTDKGQNPIHDLKQSDFTLLEDGKPQQIKSFEEHHSLPPAEAAKLEPMPKLAPGYFTNYSPVPANGAINVLLLDALNTPMKDQSFVRAQLLEYLKNSPKGVRVAIFGLTTHLIMLQGFTSDPEVLKAAVSGKAGPKGSVLLNDAVSGGSNVDNSMSEAMQEFGGSDPSSAQILANVQQFEAQAASFQLQLRAQYTLDAMNQLARYLVSLPGRKNLIWFSGSFPLNILPDGDLQDPFAAMMSAEDEYRETTNLLARSQVSVYPIDARGLFNNPAFDASQSGRAIARSPQGAAKAVSQFNDQTNGEHATMFAMAEDTGGRAFVNTNALSVAVGKAIEAGSNYYTLSYSPSDPKWQGQYRKIQVKLPQPGLNLAYRHGYYADDPDTPPKRGQESAATAPTRSSAINIALMRGAPDPTQITVEGRILPASTATEETVAPKNEINPDPKLKIKGPYKRYVLDLAVDPGNVKFVITPSDGNYHCAIEFVTLIYDHDGNIINTAHEKVTPTLPPAAYASVRKTGASFHQEISVPVKGEYFMRTAVHDLLTDRVGGIEVPIAAVAKLAPLPPEPGQPAGPQSVAAPAAPSPK
jgi:VWFA-related protein